MSGPRPTPSAAVDAGHAAQTTARRNPSGGSMRVSPSTLVSIGAIAALVAVAVTVQVLPDLDARSAQLRPWVAARALGVTAYLLLALEVASGLILSHPANVSGWHRTRQVFPWHEMVTVFTGSFIALHVALLAVDPYAKVGVLGALVPGYSEYRPFAMAMGSIALYALIVTALTAKWTRRKKWPPRTSSNCVSSWMSPWCSRRKPVTACTMPGRSEQSSVRTYSRPFDVPAAVMTRSLH